MAKKGDNMTTNETTKLNSQQKKELFMAYDAATEEIAKRRKAVIEAELAQAEITKSIFEGAGKGPFGWKGQTLRPVKRIEKDDSGNVIGERFYMRGPGQAKVEKI